MFTYSIQLANTTIHRNRCTLLTLEIDEGVRWDNIATLCFHPHNFPCVYSIHKEGRTPK